MHTASGDDESQQTRTPRVIAWEVTRRCPLSCRHCRGAARDAPYEDEFSTRECMRVLESIASFCRPVLILTGGEPMLRDDIYQVAGRATELGMRVVMAPCGLMVDEESIGRMLDAGIRCISLSLDGASPATHDSFRGREGAYEAALTSMRTVRETEMPFQINTTVTEHNVGELPELLEMAVDLGARAFNPFMLVPTGRGEGLAEDALGPEKYEQVLRWLAFQSSRPDIDIRVTCAPQYQRILRQIGRPQSGHGGCLGGKSFSFISHRGRVQICGFLETECGDLRDSDYNFRRIWEGSPVFQQVRQIGRYGGRCGQCRYVEACGGCRARADAQNGDYLAEEPCCTYEPGEVELDDTNRAILSLAQRDFPVRERPYAGLAAEVGAEPGEVLQRMRALRSAGYIRRIGGVFDSRRLGFVSTLVAARLPEDRLDAVAGTVSELPEVTHNYRRDHEFNLWFTLRARSQEALQNKLDGLRERTAALEMYSIPAEAVYNRSVTFDLTEDGKVGTDECEGTMEGDSVSLTERQRDLARVLEAHLPLVERPYRWAARRAGWETAEVLGQVRSWIEDRVLRRVAAIANHRRLGMNANGMAVFAVASDRIDEMGRELACRDDVSHCYRRRTFEGWPYGLFAMVHGDDRDEVQRRVGELAAELGAERYDVLFSTKQYKKTSPRLFQAGNEAGVE